MYCFEVLVSETEFLIPPDLALFILPAVAAELRVLVLVPFYDGVCGVDGTDVVDAYNDD